MAGVKPAGVKAAGVKATQQAAVRPSYQSSIDCGVVDALGVRRLTQFSDFFGQHVEVYTAVNDPAKRTLFRASALASKFRCATNKVGMYLARRRHSQDGIYQATMYSRASAPRG